MALKQIEKIVKQYIKPYQTKRGSRFKVEIPDGSSGQIRKQGFVTFDIAMEWALNEFNRSQAAIVSNDTPYSAMSLFDFANKWLSKKALSLSPATKLRYTRELELRILPFFGQRLLLDIHKSEIRSYKDFLDRNKNLNGTSKRMSFLLLKQILLDAEREDLIPLSGVINVSAPRAEKTTPQFWSEVEFQKFLTKNSSNPNAALWGFAFYTGLRAGEISALTWNNIELFPIPDGNIYGRIFVKQTRCQKTGQIRKQTKNGDVRVIPVFLEVFKLLSGIKREGMFVFGGDSAPDTKHWSRELKRTAKRTGFRPIKFHELRHSACSLMDSRGIPRRLVAAIMGHRDLATTNRYSHISDSTLFDALKNFDLKKIDGNQRNSHNVLSS